MTGLEKLKLLKLDLDAQRSHIALVINKEAH